MNNQIHIGLTQEQHTISQLLDMNYENCLSEQATEGDKCGKKYSNVTKGGYSQVFVRMCRQHGYSYGFHVIPNYEGPKDAFSS